MNRRELIKSALMSVGGLVAWKLGVEEVSYGRVMQFGLYEPDLQRFGITPGCTLLICDSNGGWVQAKEITAIDGYPYSQAGV